MGKWFPQLGCNVCTDLGLSENSENHIFNEKEILLEIDSFTNNLNRLFSKEPAHN